MTGTKDNDDSNSSTSNDTEIHNLYILLKDTKIIQEVRKNRINNDGSIGAATTTSSNNDDDASRDDYMQSLPRLLQVLLLRLWITISRRS